MAGRVAASLISNLTSNITSNISSSALGGAAGAALGSVAAGTVQPPASKRHVVMHHEVGHFHLPQHHSKEEVELELVVVMVVIHLAALCFFMWLMYSDKDKKKQQKPWQRGVGNGVVADGGNTWLGFGWSSFRRKEKDDREGSGIAPRSPNSRGVVNASDGAGAGAAWGGGASGGSSGSWRTPKEILASWGKAKEKQRLGKV